LKLWLPSGCRPAKTLPSDMGATHTTKRKMMCLAGEIRPPVDLRLCDGWAAHEKIIPGLELNGAVSIKKTAEAL